MTRAKLTSFKLKGFRAYGEQEQVLNLPSDLAVVWAPNSKGKTSLAEAFEFLLTGNISRKALLASSQDEFADSLRNAHIPANCDVYVAATVVGVDGKTYEVNRSLLTDFSKRGDCTTSLTINGATASESALSALGFTLSHPPLSAPILAQHTLAYIFSVRPQDRATYFKTLLEVTDLDTLRNELAQLQNTIVAPSTPLATKFDAVLSLAITTAKLRAASTISSKITFQEEIETAAFSLLLSIGTAPAGTLTEARQQIEQTLADRRSKAFPVRGFSRVSDLNWLPPPDTSWRALEKYATDKKQVDIQTSQLANLFNEALKIHDADTIDHPVDCPLCSTADALTPSRIKYLRAQVEALSGFKATEEAAKTALIGIAEQTQALIETINQSLPHFLKTGVERRHAAGFTAKRIRELCTDKIDDRTISAWVVYSRKISKGFTLSKAAATIIDSVKLAIENLSTSDDFSSIHEEFLHLYLGFLKWIEDLSNYSTYESQIKMVINSVLDANTELAGWQEFLDVSKDPELSRQQLLDRAAHNLINSEFNLVTRPL